MTKHLYLMRHGIATVAPEPGMTDDDRPLTPVTRQLSEPCPYRSSISGLRSTWPT